MYDKDWEIRLKQRSPNTAAEPYLISISFMYHSTSVRQIKGRETRKCTRSVLLAKLAYIHHWYVVVVILVKLITLGDVILHSRVYVTNARPSLFYTCFHSIVIEDFFMHLCLVQLQLFMSWRKNG